MKVMKFGGGCLKDSEFMLKVANIIKSEKTQTAIIVSAIYGVTDILIDAIQKARKNEHGISDIIKALEEKHFKILEATIKKVKIRKETYEKTYEMIKKVERLLYGVSYTEEVSSPLRAHILSFGERLSAVLLNGVLLDKGVNSEVIESDKVGLITDGNYENATVDMKEFKKNFRHIAKRIINKNIVPVITGFFGSTPDGKITTFGRNASDYSAAVFAFGFHASSIEIWKDVDGFMSADPKIVKNAHTIDRLSYYEAAELSYFGAKILHPRTTEPIAALKIPIYIKDMFNPKRKGTVIVKDGYEREDVIKSVTYNKQISMLRIHGPGVGYKPGIIDQLGHVLFKHNINIYSIITSQTCINLLVDKKDSQKSHNALKKYQVGVIERIDLDEDIALIAVVGEGILKTKGVIARVFSAVSKESVNVVMMSLGASEVATYFIVPSKDIDRTINALHREFFQKNGNGSVFKRSI
jgi:bifunctional aspartokinase / homoserine dehydrogenase 1